METEEELKSKLTWTKENGDKLLEDLEVITISLKVTKDRFSMLLKTSHDDTEVKIAGLMEEEIDSLLEKQKKIRLIFYERMADCYQELRKKINKSR